MRSAGYCVDFSKSTEETPDPLLSLDCLLSLEIHITSDIIAQIKAKPIFVAAEHVRQGASSDELLMWKTKKTEYDAILKGILIHSTKKHLHVLGQIFINGAQLHIVMYSNSLRQNFELKKGALRGEFGKPIPLPNPIKFKCIPYCQ